MSPIRVKPLCILFFILSLLSLNSFSQSSGYIIREATSTSGKTVLDPNIAPNNAVRYTSKTTSGFGSDDVVNSEIPFKVVPSFSLEPYGDLRRGPDHQYSDFVPDNGDDGVYAYYDNTNLLFRFRLGKVISGSKGYSILVDTDGKFGASGPLADPNYQPSTTGINGNPGFEIEVVLETNFRIAIYNVDGTSNPTFVKGYTNWQDMSQVSIAGTYDNGDPDFFMDFYIPFSDLQAAPFNLTTSTSIRLSATTVMAPKGAIGGPKSDIYGVSDDGFGDADSQYEEYIKAQCGFTITSLQSSTVCPMCTAAPAVNSSISQGTVTISGTWTKANLTGAQSTATITVYRNGVSVGTIPNVTSGTTWTLNNIAVTAGQEITAKAQGTGESMCLSSNAVKVASACTSINRPAKPTLSCTTPDKGLTGTNLSTGWTVHVNNISTNTNYNSVSNIANGEFGTSAGTSPNMTWNFSGGCTTGNPMPGGAYMVYYTDNNNGGCASEPVFVCAKGNGSNTFSTTVPSITPVITSILTPGTQSLSGTGEPNARVYLYVNGALLQSSTVSAAVAPATTGTFTFSSLSLANNEVVYVTNVLVNSTTPSSGKCASSSTIATVKCYRKPPILTADGNNEVAASQPIKGISSEPAGTVIKVYETTNTTTPVATTTVQSDFTWSTGNTGTTPSLYNAIAGTSYYATAGNNTTCNVSANSGTVTARTATSTSRCGSIQTPITVAGSSVSGTLTGSFTSTTVRLYQDSTAIGFIATNNTSWTIPVNTIDSNRLYPNGVLMIGVKEDGKQEVFCQASKTTIACTPAPAAPIISPSNATISPNGAVTYTVSNAVSGAFYGVADANTGASMGDGKWATSNGSLTLSTKSIPSNGTYDIVINSTIINGMDVCSAQPSAAKVNVTNTVPVHLISFKGKKVQSSIELEWVVENEVDFKHYVVERSFDGIAYKAIGTVAALGRINRSTYQFIDKGDLMAANYYRLRLVDTDGRYSYSHIIKFNGEGSFSSTTVWPNPFSSELNIETLLHVSGFITLNLLNEQGIRVLTKQTLGHKGQNNITVSIPRSLPPGVYFMQIQSANGISQQKLIRVTN